MFSSTTFGLCFLKVISELMLSCKEKGRVNGKMTQNELRYCDTTLKRQP